MHRLLTIFTFAVLGVVLTSEAQNAVDANGCQILSFAGPGGTKYKFCPNSNTQFYESKERANGEIYWTRIRKSEIPFPPAPTQPIAKPLSSVELSAITNDPIDKDSLMFCNGTRTSMWMAYERNGFDVEGRGIAINWESAYEIRPATCRQVAAAGMEVHVSIWSKDQEYFEVPAFNTQSRGSRYWCFPVAERAGLFLNDADYQDYKPTPPCKHGEVERRISFHAYLEKGEGEEIVIGDYTQAQYQADQYEAWLNRPDSGSGWGSGYDYRQDMCSSATIDPTREKPYYCD